MSEIFFPWEDKLHMFKPTFNFLFIIKDMSVSKIKTKRTRRKSKEKQEMTSAISSLVRIWKISHSYPGCSFVWKIRVVYFSVKHSYLYNKCHFSISFFDLIMALVNVETSLHFFTFFNFIKFLNFNILLN